MEEGSEFDNFEQFEHALKKYCLDNCVQYSKTDSKSITVVNKTLKTPIDEKFRFRYVKYQCKHGSKNKKKRTQIKGLRPNQRTFDTGCTASLSATVNRTSNKLVIQCHTQEHNHELSGEIFKKYPERRRDLDVNLKQNIESMLKMGVKVKTLRDFLTNEKQHYVTAKDLHNMRKKMKLQVPCQLHEIEEEIITDLEQIKTMSQPLQLAAEAVMVQSESMPEGAETVKGYDFNKGVNYHALLQSYGRSGFQATNFGKAVEEINKMIDKKMEPIPGDRLDALNLNPCGRDKTNCTIFLGYTSNLISSGVREVLRYLAQHNMVDVIVSTAGGIEEDFIKCLAPTYLGDFSLDGRTLRDKGINRIGNLLVPNENYCKFEKWLMPILDQMLKEQKEEDTHWTPSKMISRLGKEIDNEDSVYYWAHRNNIPVFCPALTDGSIGDMIYFHSYKNPGLILDLVEDIRRLNGQATFAINSGMIILGGGVIKHHICNANLMRNGADFSLFVNTASEFDGSDSGARPDEAISWGKIKKSATPVKVYAETTLVFPLMVAETFARREKEFKMP